MGVHGLWDLLAPVGRRVSVETLSGKKLAIDASIWMVQFMKAMRDDKGEMVRNAHVLGFFRRICKLLYLRTKPVFVFDGGTPALKRRTVIARRKQRENAQAKIRKTAEKLLLNQLKAMRLKELAKDLENQRKVNSDGVGHKGVKGKNALSDRLISESCRNVEVDKMRASSHLVADAQNSENSTSTPAAFTVVEEDSEGEDQMILPAMDSYVDPAVLAALPPSLQRDLLSGSRSGVGDRDVDHLVKEDFSGQNEENKKKSKGKEVLSDISNTARCNFKGDVLLAVTLDQQKLDEMLAASLAAEEDGLYKNAARSDAHIISDVEDGSEHEAEEMILPVHGKVDPSILAALPPSVQLDLLVQMRERLMAENRQKYQKVKKAPEKFSELQIEAYLKTVAFRREIDEVQKAASGKVLDGVQTSRIASEANREFIFSTSFSGDKQSLTSSVPSRRNGDKPLNNTGKPPFPSVDNIASFQTSNSGTELPTGKTKIGFDEGVETYLDGKGLTRMSRLRAMGMRMTHDLQRNLDLMKEIEQEQTQSIKITGSYSGEEPSEVSGSKNATLDSLNSIHGQSMLNVGTSVQISFEVGESKCSGSDDDMFIRLASGQLIEFSSDKKEQKAGRLSGSASDSDWEDGVVNGRGDKSSENVVAVHSSLKASDGCDDSEVEWEEGGFDDPMPAQSEKPVYKGDLEEDSELQEAIKRSLKDLEGRKINHTHIQAEKGETSTANESSETARFLYQGNNACGKNKSGGLVLNQMSSRTLGSGKQDEVGWTEKLAIPTEISSETELGCGYPQLCKYAVRDGSLDENAAHINFSTNFVEESIPLVVENSSGDLVDKEGTTTSLEISSGDNLPSGSPSSGYFSRDLVNGDRGDKGAEPLKLVVEDEIFMDESSYGAKISNPSISVTDSSRIGSNNGVSTSHNLSGKVNLNHEIGGEGHFMEKSSIGHDGSTEANMRHAELEEEMLLLHKEYENLGAEQRKLERNADSISGEMFAECQELLQMFGLPYIIAPMEAEAQCAHMEIAGLVDGIVTDDSDVFLFGARNVYKNIFDERKYVETYFMKDVEKELGLTREKLIRLALLLGSDYTEGVSGVGIVNAIEIVNAFSEEDGLQKFREWLESPDPSILGETEAQNCTDPRKGSTKFGDRCAKSTSCPEEHSVHDIEEIKQIFMDKHRNVSKNWHIPASFPSGAVIAAYLSPHVDKSTEPFSLGKPYLHALQRLCWEKLGWDIRKSNELLLPVLKEYNKHETQLRMDAFYTFNERFAKIRSKRITKAVESITKNQSMDVMDDATGEVSNTKKKRKANNDKSYDDWGERQSGGKETSSSKKNDSVRSASTRTRRKKTDGQVQGGCPERNQKRSRGDRGGGRERGRRTKRGKTTRSSSSWQSDSGCDHEGYNDEEPHVGSSEHLQEPRRSTRPRKAASYVEDDLEHHGIEPVDLRTKGSDEEAAEQDLSSLHGVERSSASDLGKNGQCEHDLSVPRPSEYNAGCQATISGDEDETVQQPDISLPIEVDASKDYLKMGGGFCFEESETKEDTDTSSSQQYTGLNFGPSGFSVEPEADSGLLQGTSSSSRVSKELHERDPADFDSEKSLVLGGAREMVDSSNVCLPEMKTKSESPCPNALTPMPFLKRKRRKH